MQESIEHDAHNSGYNEIARMRYDDRANTKPAKQWPVNGRRRASVSTITDVRVAGIRTVSMTAEEETEAVEAFAVLLARYWREHPDEPL